ncbi:DcuS/MalK family sensor histidine kinase [Neobacillus sp. MER 74]|uniref:DcuS/MalK family sensor histidine kinase n=1 Tax=unclassified Neobacillus TaxID=2675272 RepID=UPI00203BF98D|nr:DcuS/MalK family sensor histidine kinase [Neobacillus sp. MER 74]MCM3118470.1 DcuS/MalK family sensor histidine kinase [Neobacillus sp. MER 74]
MRRGRWSLKSVIIVFVCVVVTFSLLITDLLISSRIASETEKNQAEQARSVARMVAHSPLVIEAMSGKRDEKDIQSYANEMRKVTNVYFIVVMDMNAIRKSHPDSNKIGLPFRGGDEGPVLKGREHASISKGSLGPSLRSFTPIKDEKGKQIGAVAVGISLDNVEKAVKKSRTGIYIGTLIGLLIGVLGAVILARYIKKILLGLEPFAIAKLLEERSAMLQSVREGIVAVDQESKITLVNRAALKMFHKAGLPDNPMGVNIERYLSTTRLKDLLQTGKAELDEEQNLNGMTILTNRVPVIVGNKVVGAIATFRDKTEIQVLAEELTGVRTYADALRAQAHEYMNKLHVILGMVHTGYYEKVVEYINETVNHRNNEIGFVTKKIKDPVLAGFLIGKLSYARESGTELSVLCEQPIPQPEDSDITHELITILGNLIDNAIMAVSGCPLKKVTVSLDYADDILTIEVKDTGKGMSEEIQNQIFNKGFSTKGENRGLGLYLVSQAVKKLDGDLILSSKPEKGTVFAVYIPYDGEGDRNDPSDDR